MNVLLIGSGGREHAMAWKIAQSSLLDALWVAPGNPGTVRHGRNAEVDINDHKALRKFLLEKDIRIVVVGPEGPLVDGLHDRIADDPQLAGKVTVIGPVTVPEPWRPTMMVGAVVSVLTWKLTMLLASCVAPLTPVK
jgi:phosphoribosylamine--glycine ligase